MAEKTALTRDELELVSLFRALGEKERRHLKLAAEALKANAEKQRNRF